MYENLFHLRKSVSWSVITSSQGRDSSLNEDSVGYNALTIVLSDGATDKTGLRFDGKTGGQILSKAVVESCLASSLTGVPLVRAVTEKIREIYKEINPKALKSSAYRSAAMMLTAKIVEGQVIITSVGDANFRINGKDTYTHGMKIDKENALLRKAAIEQTGDIPGGRAAILGRLKQQHVYQNNPKSEYGYGVIDGTEVPEQFVIVYTFPLKSVKTVELVSDGFYEQFPKKVSIKAYEELYQIIEHEDPDKYFKYPATKPKDDRTVLIAKLKH